MALHHNTAKKYARNLMKALAAVAQHNVDNELVFVHTPAEEATAPVTMSQVLLQYRQTYVKAVSYSKGPTMDNGDQLAAALRGMAPDEVCELADAVFNLAIGSHMERYQHLNKGQQRMNAGNRIRASVKKGETTIEQVMALINGEYPDEEVEV